MKRNMRHLMGLPPARPRAAFTMLEMIVAIGIILILLAISVVGFRALDASASAKETASTLTNLQGMMAEIESTSGLNRVEGAEGVYTRGDKIIPGPQPQPPQPPVRNPHSVVTGTGGGEDNRYGLAVRRTQEVISRLSRVPKNKTSLAQIPGKRLLGKAPYRTNTIPNKVLVVESPTESAGLPSSPVLLDGWRNPIIFVPSGGLEGVTITGSTVVITSSGQRKAGEASIVTDRPFWASAGADGDFSTGEDNIYSFSKG